MLDGWLFPEVRTETKLEGRDRARRMIRLIWFIHDAPVHQEIMEGQDQLCAYFIERALAGELSLNDLDSIARNIGSLDEMSQLTEKDDKEMRDDEAAWKVMPLGWLGSRPGEKYCSRLHPKEIAVLESIREEIAGDLEDLTESIPVWTEELAALRAVGPLSEDVALRHNLTPEGYRRTQVAA